MLSPEILLTLSPSVLRALLSTFAPSGLAGLPAKAPATAIARHLFAHAAASPAKLASVLSSPVARFATSRGRLAIVEAARAAADARVDAWLAAPAADVAPLLAIERATGQLRARRAAKRLFALASHRVERDLPERPTYELVAESPAAPGAAAVQKRLARALGSSLVDAWSATDADGTVRLALFLCQPTENRLVRDDAASTRATPRRDVPVAVDLARISPDGARFAVTTAMPELLPVYAAALSLSLHPSFTLRPLHDLTRAQLSALLASPALASSRITGIDVVALRYRRPDGARIEVRASDALDPSLHVPRSGYVDRATIRFAIDGAHLVDVFLQLPHRLEISDASFAPPVRAALSALGLFAPGALPDDARSLAPYVHGDWRWCAVLGDAAFEAFVKIGRLVRALASHVATHEHRMHGAAYVVRDVPGEREAGDERMQYALAEDRSLGARLVSPKDRVAWRLDLTALAGAMRTDLGATRASSPLAIAGVLDLGLVTLPSGKLRIVYAMAAPPAGWVESLRRACGLGVTPVVLVPRGHAGEATGMLEIELDLAEQLGTKRIGRVLGKIAEALDVASEVETWRRCDEEVVIDVAGERLWVSGVLVSLTDKPRSFVEYLARRPGKIATSAEVGGAISKSGYPDVAARRAKAEVDRQVRETLEAQGADASIVERMIVVEGKRGYRFGVSVRVL